MSAPLKYELDRKTFVQRLVDVGWNRKEAEAEWDRIQEEPDESGYDGP